MSAPASTRGWVQDPRRRHAVEVRRKVERGIRDFFEGRGFLETRTPLLVRSPGMEPHLRPYRVDGGAYLPTSPEFAMKRLLVGGLPRIFQLAPAFRREPVSPQHLPEFTLLEWYRAEAGAAEIMEDAEALIAALAEVVHGAPRIPWRGGSLDVAPPWPRLRVRELFAEHAGVDLVDGDLRQACGHLGLHAAPDDGWDDLYFRIWLSAVEPRLPADRPVFVTRYPASQAALSVIVSEADGSRWAERFEIYLGGLELANAFEELTDPVEQRRRFEADMALRARAYGPSFPPSPIDEEFLTALAEGMPRAGGIALGVDRLVMLLAGEEDIRYTTWLLPLGEAPP